MGARAEATAIAAYGERLLAISRVVHAGSGLVSGMLVKKWKT
jgi:hypothetical protein